MMGIRAFDAPVKAAAIYPDFSDEDVEAGEIANSGCTVRSQPRRNRKSDCILADPSKWRSKKHDAETTALLSLHNLPDSKERTGDFEAVIERNRKRLVRYARHEPSAWARLCAVRDRWHDLRSTDRNADLRAFEAFAWIENVEADPEREIDRKAMTWWLRSGLEWNAFAKLTGFRSTHAQAMRAFNAYCEVILARLSYATPPRLQNNSTEHAVIRGVSAIAFATGKRTSTVLRWIEGGRKPIANLAGQPAMLRDLAA